MRYSVMIIGAGQIAAGYDEPYSESILTHAHAVCKHSGFDLLGFYDTDADKAGQAAKKWESQAFYVPQYADVIVICTPDDAHIESVTQAAELSPKFIILEKPIARNLKDVEKILKFTKNIPTQVNFTRRFAPVFQELAAGKTDYGAFISGTGLYGKGFVHNGSHMIDLLRLLVGEVESAEQIGEFDDFYADDLTKTAILRLRNGEFYMRGVDCKHYTVFELDLCFEKARVQILEGGNLIKIYKPIPSEQYRGYVYLFPYKEMIPKLDYAMLNLYQNVYDHLTKGEKLLSPIEGAIAKGLYAL